MQKGTTSSKKIRGKASSKNFHKNDEIRPVTFTGKYEP
jgi:hypothetical protein